MAICRKLWLTFDSETYGAAVARPINFFCGAFSALHSESSLQLDCGIDYIFLGQLAFMLSWVPQLMSGKFLPRADEH